MSIKTVSNENKTLIPPAECLKYTSQNLAELYQLMQRESEDRDRMLDLASHVVIGVGAALEALEPESVDNTMNDGRYVFESTNAIN